MPSVFNFPLYVADNTVSSRTGRGMSAIFGKRHATYWIPLMAEPPSTAWIEYCTSRFVQETSPGAMLISGGRLSATTTEKLLCTHKAWSSGADHNPFELLTRRYMTYM